MFTLLFYFIYFWALACQANATHLQFQANITIIKRKKSNFLIYYITRPFVWIVWTQPKTQQVLLHNIHVMWLPPVSLCNFTLFPWTWPPAVKVQDSDDIVFSHDPLGNVPPRKAARHDKKILKEHKGTKKAEGAAAESAVSGPTEDSASPYSRATQILSEC